MVFFSVETTFKVFADYAVTKTQNFEILSVAIACGLTWNVKTYWCYVYHISLYDFKLIVSVNYAVKHWSYTFCESANKEVMIGLLEPQNRVC